MPRWQPGKSGNPKGRPPKGKSLTEALDRTLPAAKLARFIKDAIFFGIVPRQDGTHEVLDADKRISLAQWAYTRIDGAPIQRIEADVTETQAYTADELAEAERELREWTPDSQEKSS